MAKTVAEVLPDQMIEAGIKNVYGFVGDSANPIVDGLRRNEEVISSIHVRNEEAGAFAAGADTQISGRPTAVLGSSGRSHNQQVDVRRGHRRGVGAGKVQHS